MFFFSFYFLDLPAKRPPCFASQVVLNFGSRSRVYQVHTYLTGPEMSHRGSLTASTSIMHIFQFFLASAHKCTTSQADGPSTIYTLAKII